MLLSFIDTYLLKNYYTVHVHVEDTLTLFNVIHIKKEKTTVTIVEQDSTERFETLVANLKKSIPVLLTFTGKKVINKKVPQQANYLDKILFNQNPDEFYINEVVLESDILVSVVRKNDVDHFLDKFRDHDISVRDFFIGPYNLDGCQRFLTDSDKICTPLLTYTFEGSILSSPSEEEILEDINLGDEVLKAENILAFSSFIKSMNKENSSTNYQEVVEVLAEESSFRKAFTVAGALALGICMLLLLVSYGVTSIYTAKNVDIQAELTINKELSLKMETLKKDKRYKENVISNSSLGTPDFLSFYISEIAQSVPNDVALQELNLFPTEGQINSEEKIVVTPRKFTIAGATSSKYSVNNWIELLDAFTWIQKTEIASYAFIKNEYVFTLNLFL